MEIARATPIHVIGDSSVLIYGDHVVRTSGGEAFVVRSAYCALHVSRLADERGVLDAPFSAALRGMGLALPAGAPLEALHVSADPHAHAVRRARGRELGDPALVLSSGYIDLAGIVREFPHDDFVLPDGIEQRFAVPPVCRENEPGAAPALELMTLIHTSLANFRRGLRALRALGFERLGLLSLPPVGLDDEAWLRIKQQAALRVSPGRNGIRWRYKCVLAMNDALLRVCAEEGADFIDRWPDQTVNGLARAGLLAADGVHVTKAGAEGTVRALAHWARTTAAVRESIPA